MMSFNIDGSSGISKNSEIRIRLWEQKWTEKDKFWNGKIVSYVKNLYGEGYFERAYKALFRGMFFSVQVIASLFSKQYKEYLNDLSQAFRDYDSLKSRNFKVVECNPKAGVPSRVVQVFKPIYSDSSPGRKILVTANNTGLKERIASSLESCGYEEYISPIYKLDDERIKELSPNDQVIIMSSFRSQSNLFWNPESFGELPSTIHKLSQKGIPVDLILTNESSWTYSDYALDEILKQMSKHECPVAHLIYAKPSQSLAQSFPFAALFAPHGSAGGVDLRVCTNSK